MTWFLAVLAVAVLGVAAVVAGGRLGAMPEPASDEYRQDLPTDRELTATDLRSLRFAVSVRGYSMRQVDAVLARLMTELTDRDRQLAELAAPEVSEDPPGSAARPRTE